MHRALQSLLHRDRYFWIRRSVVESEMVLGQMVDFIHPSLCRADKTKTPPRLLVWPVDRRRSLQLRQPVWPVLHPRHAVLGIADGRGHFLAGCAHRTTSGTAAKLDCRRTPA